MGNAERKLGRALSKLDMQINTGQSTILVLKRNIEYLEVQNEKLKEARTALIELLYQTDADGRLEVKPIRNS